MGFTDKLLMTDEKIEHQTTLEPWLAFSRSGGTLLLALAFFSTGASGMGVFLLTASLVTALFDLINYKTSFFVVTNKRVLVRTGLVKRVSLELMLAKIEAVAYHESLTERMNRTGSLVICGTGGTKQPLPRIKNPLEFKRQLQQKIDQIQKSA